MDRACRDVLRAAVWGVMVMPFVASAVPLDVMERREENMGRRMRRRVGEMLERRIPTPTSSSSSTTASPPVATVTQEVTQTGASETKEHWMIAGGAVVGFIVICAILFSLWKWRSSVAGLFRRRDKRMSHIDPMTGTAYMIESQSMDLYGDDKSMIGVSYDVKSDYKHKRPPPALAPSNGNLERHNSRRKQMVRSNLLDDFHMDRYRDERRQTFFLEDDEEDLKNNTITEWRELRKTSNTSLSVSVPAKTAATITTVQSDSPYADFVPPSIPDSPEAARDVNRFSWKSRDTKRSSVDSEPARFRTINSWVSNQANHLELEELRRHEREKEAEQQLATALRSPPPPKTPSVCRAHPGAPVSFGGTVKHKRIASQYLDEEPLNL